MNSEEARKIGFNDHIDVGGIAYHVQTEVMGRGELKARTLVYESGVIQHAESQPLGGEGRSLEELRSEVDAQHRRVVSLVRAGLQS
ncbi:MAG: hypothetical protein OEY14_11080 [Myxococcales bacterium]|nr:hypothetical protein [Myxococcales bacterium]